ncbi:MAG TPA: hypothetical protein VIM11_23325 [Tepidisphaeraceae bacterium]
MNRNILPYFGRAASRLRECTCGWASLAPGAFALLLMLAVLSGHWQLSVHLNGLIALAVALAICSNGTCPGLAGFALATVAFVIELFLLLMTAAITGR